MLFPRLRRLSRVQSDSPRGLHGNPRKNLSILSLWTPLKENSFKNPSVPFPLLSYPRRISLVFAKEELSPPLLARALDFRASLASSEQAARRSQKKKKMRKKKKKKKKKEEKEEEKERAERSAATPLREVYFANKTGPVPCLLKQ